MSATETGREHRIELDAARLIDRQQVALDRLERCAHLCGTRQVASCVAEAMRCRSDLGLNKRRAGRAFHACELRGERIQAVERIQIAKKLCCQMLSGDNGLGDAWKAGVLSETCPGATARTLQVDRGDLPVGRGWMRKVKVHDCAHSRLRSGILDFRDPS